MVRILALVFVLASFLIAAYAYPAMPESMAIHWGPDGTADGFSGRDFGVFFMPLLSLAVFGIFMALPELDPLRENYRAFILEYNTFAALLSALLFYVYVLTLISNLGVQFDMLRFIAPAMGFIVFYTGILLKKAKRNWFVGIRTPWTLSSEQVWKRTHNVCSGLFKAAGVLLIIGVSFQPAVTMAFAILVGTAVFGFVYSFIEFRRLGSERTAQPERKTRNRKPKG